LDIYLIRHGESRRSSSEYYDSDKKVMNPPLTENGIRQAEALAGRCKALSFDAVFSSDLARAVETAGKIITASPGKLIIDAAFREIDFGEINFKSWDDFPDLYKKWTAHDDDTAYPSGESGGDVWRRCRPALEKIIASDYKKAAVVCHGGTIRSIICGILDIPQQKRFYLGVPPENCSISIIKYNEKDKKIILHTFNDYSHIKL